MKRCSNCDYHQDCIEKDYIICNLLHFKAWGNSVGCKYWKEYVCVY